MGKAGQERRGHRCGPQAGDWQGKMRVPGREPLLLPARGRLAYLLPGRGHCPSTKSKEKRHVTSALITLPLAPMKPSDPTHWGSHTGHPTHLKCTPGPSVRAPHTPCWWLQWLWALPHHLRPLKHPSRLRPLQVACKEAAKMLGVLESPSRG